MYDGKKILECFRASNSRNWLPCDIVDYYDAHLDCTLRELASMTGKTIPELKRILMSE